MSRFDPYDLWSTAALGQIKQKWYSGSIAAGISLRFIVLLDWFFPVLLRKRLGIVQYRFAHVEAMRLFSVNESGELFLCLFRQMLTPSGGWGLPFGWYSKNGIYDANTPYVTNTPYVMEALLGLAGNSALHEEAMAMFQGTWKFLESLKVMHEDDTQLALSYAPVEEPRTVVNANAYASFAYALHAIHGRPEVRKAARSKSLRLVRWVVSQQENDGSWYYYSDHEPGNFIDGFHSCFVIKNLLKVKDLLSETESLVDATIERGWLYIRNNLFDDRAGLCRRFAQRAHRDPFRWDLYDQAEYLGLLIDFGLFDEASEFAARVEKCFMKGPHWYCRIDLFGRRWGKDFMRWGIAPFLYHRARLDKAQRIA